MLDSSERRMPLSYAVYREHCLVIITGSGRVTWDEIKERQDQIKSDPDFNPEFNEIVDLRAVTAIDMSSEHAQVLARRMLFSFASKRAFVAADPVVFGVARTWENFTHISDNPSQIRLFNDLPSALKWLKLDSLPG
jgi:hypothetical protein